MKPGDIELLQCSNNVNYVPPWRDRFSCALCYLLSEAATLHGNSSSMSSRPVHAWMERASAERLIGQRIMSVAHPTN